MSSAKFIIMFTHTGFTFCNLLVISTAYPFPFVDSVKVECNNQTAGTDLGIVTEM